MLAFDVFRLIYGPHSKPAHSPSVRSVPRKLVLDEAAAEIRVVASDQRLSLAISFRDIANVRESLESDRFSISQISGESLHFQVVRSVQRSRIVSELQRMIRDAYTASRPSPQSSRQGRRIISSPLTSSPTKNRSPKVFKPLGPGFLTMYPIQPQFSASVVSVVHPLLSEDGFRVNSEVTLPCMLWCEVSVHGGFTVRKFPKDPKPVFEISLDYCSPTVVSGSEDFFFSFSLVDSFEFLFCATSAEERLDWIDTLVEGIRAARPLRPISARSPPASGKFNPASAPLSPDVVSPYQDSAADFVRSILKSSFSKAKQECISELIADAEPSELKYYLLEESAIENRVVDSAVDALWQEEDVETLTSVYGSCFRTRTLQPQGYPEDEEMRDGSAEVPQQVPENAPVPSRTPSGESRGPQPRSRSPSGASGQSNTAASVHEVPAPSSPRGSNSPRASGRRDDVSPLVRQASGHSMARGSVDASSSPPEPLPRSPKSRASSPAAPSPANASNQPKSPAVVPSSRTVTPAPLVRNDSDQSINQDASHGASQSDTAFVSLASDGASPVGRISPVKPADRSTESAPGRAVSPTVVPSPANSDRGTAAQRLGQEPGSTLLSGSGSAVVMPANGGLSGKASTPSNSGQKAGNSPVHGSTPDKSGEPAVSRSEPADAETDSFAQAVPDTAPILADRATLLQQIRERRSNVFLRTRPEPDTHVDVASQYQSVMRMNPAAMDPPPSNMQLVRHIVEQNPKRKEVLDRIRERHRARLAEVGLVPASAPAPDPVSSTNEKNAPDATHISSTPESSAPLPPPPPPSPPLPSAQPVASSNASGNQVPVPSTSSAAVVQPDATKPATVESASSENVANVTSSTNPSSVTSEDTHPVASLEQDRKAILERIRARRTAEQAHKDVTDAPDSHASSSTSELSSSTPSDASNPSSGGAESASRIVETPVEPVSHPPEQQMDGSKEMTVGDAPPVQELPPSDDQKPSSADNAAASGATESAEVSVPVSNVPETDASKASQPVAGSEPVAGEAVPADSTVVVVEKSSAEASSAPIPESNANPVAANPSPAAAPVAAAASSSTASSSSSTSASSTSSSEKKLEEMRARRYLMKLRNGQVFTKLSSKHPSKKTIRSIHLANNDTELVWMDRMNGNKLCGSMPISSIWRIIKYAHPGQKTRRPPAQVDKDRAAGVDLPHLRLDGARPLDLLCSSEEERVEWIKMLVWLIRDHRGNKNFAEVEEW